MRLRISREKAVFGGAAAVVALLAIGLFGSMLEERNDRVVPKRVEFEEPVARSAWLVPPGDEVYRPGGRDPFREPREIEDLPPLDLPLPPPPGLPVVAPPPWPGLEAKALAMLRRPFAVARPGEDVAATNGAGGESRGSADQDGRQDGGTPAASAAAGSPPAAAIAPGGRAPAGGEGEALLDAVTLKGGQTLSGRIEVADPLAILGAEIDAREDRFAPKPGVRFRMVVRDRSTGRSLGSTEYESAQIDSIVPARTVATRARLAMRRLTPSDVRGRVALGHTCLASGELALAREAFDAALAIDPASAEAILGLGDTHRAVFEWDAEHALYRRALLSGGGGSLVRIRLAEIEDLFGLERKAEETLREGLSASPGDAQLALALGRILARRSGSRAEGLSLLKRAADSAPDSATRARALEAAAEALLVSGDAASAAERAARAREAAPDRGTPVALAAAADIVAGRAPAGPVPEDRPDLAPGAAAYVSALGRLARGDEAAAVEADLARAEAEWPLLASFPAAARGYLLLREGRIDEAQERLESAIEFDPGLAHPRYLLGRLKAEGGDVEGAAALYRSALEILPTFSDALAELSVVSLRDEDPDMGVRYARRALDLDPTRSDVRTVLALHLLRGRGAEAARRELEAAAAESADAAPALNALAALVYREGGDADRLQAIDFFQRVLEAPPEHVREEDREYAAAHLAAIRDNVSKCQWVDGFNRSEIRRDWAVSERYGIDVRIEGGRLRFAGRQTQEDRVTSVLREFPHGRLVSFEAVLAIPKGTNARCGILLANMRQDDVYAGIELARDPKGGLSYRTTRAGKPSDWTAVEGFTWPDDEPTAVGIELTDLKLGLYDLLVGGRRVLEGVKVESLRGSTAPVRLGVFGTARIGAEYAFGADDVRVVLRKE